MGINTFIQIGNSDDRLTQAEWSAFIADMRNLFRSAPWTHAKALQIHGEWFSGPDQSWQNANWCVEILPPAWWRAAVERVGQDTEALNDPMQSASAVHARDSDTRRARSQLKAQVQRLCRRYRQDSFAWTTGEVELVETGWQETPSPDPGMRQAHAEGWPPLDQQARYLDSGSVYLNQEDHRRIREVVARNRHSPSPSPSPTPMAQNIPFPTYSLPTLDDFQQTRGAAEDSTSDTLAPASTGGGNPRAACDNFTSDEDSTRCGACSQPFENHKVA